MTLHMLLRGFCVLLTLSFLPIALMAQSPLRATTEDGRLVLLHDDGTWEFAPADAQADTVVLKTGFTRPASADKQVKTNVDAFSVWMESSKWIRSDKGKAPNRKEFLHSKGDSYAILISERIGIPISTLREIVLQNARESATEVKVINEERRIVNGVEVLHIRMKVVIQGIPFTFAGYYFGGDEGSFQVIGYTSENLFPSYEKDIFDMLNGTTITLSRKEEEK